MCYIGTGMKDIIKDISSVEKAQSQAKTRQHKRNQERLKMSQEKMTYQQRSFKAKQSFMNVQDRFEEKLEYQRRMKKHRVEQRENQRLDKER